jgi:hypothetical protein
LILIQIQNIECVFIAQHISLAYVSHSPDPLSEFRLWIEADPICDPGKIEGGTGDCASVVLQTNGARRHGAKGTHVSLEWGSPGADPQRQQEQLTCVQKIKLERNVEESELSVL